MVRPAGQISLVTFPQAGHSYAIRPGSIRSGAILMISCIGARQRGQAIPLLLLARSDTTRPQHSYSLLSRQFATNPTVSLCARNFRAYDQPCRSGTTFAGDKPPNTQVSWSRFGNDPLSMRKTALGTDRRPAHCFSVQDDDELGQLGMVTKLIFRPQPRQGPPRCWGPLPFQRPRQNAPP